jgi:hypothetical protein
VSSRDLVVEVILRGETDRARLDAHVDVFGDEDHFALGVRGLEVHHDADDLVVGLARSRGQARGQRAAIASVWRKKRASRGLVAA